MFSNVGKYQEVGCSGSGGTYGAIDFAAEDKRATHCVVGGTHGAVDHARSKCQSSGRMNQLNVPRGLQSKALDGLNLGI